MPSFEDDVWTNAAYPLSALGAWGHPTTMAVIAVLGTLLGIASALYHTTDARWAQRADVTAMMTYLWGLEAALLPTETPWKWAVPVAAALAYGVYTWSIDTQIHVPLAVDAIGIAMAVQVGWAALVPLAVFGVAALVRKRSPHTDHLLHSIWHVLGALAAALALFITL